ncbi:MBL fold metallo-hydrolase [Pullulanibacillus camelliae]|uniref:MBL fold metallo-hydrolase n=1 Tax=Pullulanibacillus camelliae TaxID=1707096 RepID=A0A8J2YER6_9BACL|nr:MBL fold metallo-hydrolase [Pullulanibacillus camelliae]GGE29258.1 MBL fold metallo-hydrolase [Pullulanibacillus camelliae]
MEITKQVHLLEGTKGSYSYLVTGQEPVLVDTSMPGRAKRIIEALAHLGMQPTDIAHIVLTHQDVDHIGNAKGLKQISGARLWAPKEEVPYIHGAKKGQGIRRLINGLIKVDRPQVDRMLEEGQYIGELEVIPAPGHTEGHVCLRVGDVLLAGDLVTTRKGKLKSSPGFLTKDKHALAKSIRSVGQLKFDWICPAHGDPVQRGSLWETLLP